VTILTASRSLARVDMRAAKKTTESRKVLQELVPLNSLSSERFDSLVEKIVIEEVKSGRYLFRKGDRDNQTIYLLAGKISLMDGFRKVSGEIEAGTEASRHPIAAQQPRPYSARVTKKAVIARIDSGLLDAFLSWDHSSTAEVVDIGEDDDGDWMTRLLQSEAFRKFSPSKLQGLLMKMQPLAVSKGEIVIAEGEEGDYFYTIHEGRCAVSRQEKADGKPQLLAELGIGASFGEDALVSNQCRNATVTMLTDGTLMRLAKNDFVELLKTQLVRHVTPVQAEQMISEGAVWMDARTRDEHLHGSPADSINIPLATLRDKLSELVMDVKYIICCDTGRRSESAAFLLSHKGFDVCVLEKGLQNYPQASAAPAIEESPGGVLELVAAGPMPAEVAAEERAARLQADYDALRCRHEELLAEQQQRHAAEARLEGQIEQLRDELGGTAGKLGEFNAQVNAHTTEKQSLLDQYADLEKTYTEQLQSMQLELDKERSKAQELASHVKVTAGECDALKGQLADVEQDTQTEMTRMQEALAQARGRVSEMESAIESSNADRAALQKESAVNSEQHRKELQSMQVELSAACDEVERLSTGLAEVTDERQELAGEIATLRAEITALQEATSATSAKLGEEGEVVTALRAQNAGQGRQIVHLQAELAKRQSLLDSRTADHENRIQELQQQLEHQLADGEYGHKELQSLQDELATARHDAERLSADLATVTEERRELASEIATLGGAMAALQEAAMTTSARLGEEGEVAAQLRAQNDELIRQAGLLQAELAERDSQLESIAAGNEARTQQLLQQLEQLQAELAERESQLESIAAGNETRTQQLQQQLKQLQAELAERESQLENTTAESVLKTQQLQQQLEQLQAELAGRESQLESTTAESELKTQQLQQQLEQLQVELAGRESQLENTTAESEVKTQQLQQQLEQLQVELAGRESQLESTTAENEVKTRQLQQQLEQLQAELVGRESQLENTAAENEARTQQFKEQLEQLQAELAERESELESSVAGHEARARDLQQQLDQQLAGLQQAQQQLQKVTAEHQQAHATIDSLKEENRQLEKSGSIASREYQAQLQRAEGLLAERNAAAAVYAKQQSEWGDQRTALQQQAAMEQQLAAGLGKELEQLTSAMAEASADFEQQLQQQVEEASAVLEQQEQRFAELELSASATADEFELLKQQHEDLALQSEKSAIEKAGLYKEIADKDARIEAARLELSQYEVDKTVLGQELELSRQQVQELQQALVEHQAKIKTLEQDLQESMRKAHDDLKRKNENEKELQGNIELQRKKLDQLTADYQKSRSEAQDAIDYLRDELHAERDARDVERVEMATRQRELKEQLAAAAGGAHEGGISAHPGEIAEAVESARAEERGRLQGVLDAHAETEQRLAKVQAELQQAHAELAEHHHEEKSRRQGDIELMAEQNRQAEAAIAQLQDQLQQLTGERDGALEEQQELHAKMDSLRAEIKAARELTNAPGKGQLEDPVQLRKQLDDTRRNVTIAVRLRTEAEAARDRLLEERDKLLVQVENSQNVGVAAHNPAARADSRETAQPESAPKQAAGGVSRASRWLGPAVGSVAVGVIAMAVWLLMAVELQVQESPAIVIEETRTTTEAEDMPQVAVVPPATETVVQAPAAELEQPAPIVREKSASTAELPKPDNKKVVQAPVTEKQAEPVPEETPAAATSPVVRTYNDRLRGGGKGPAMVELAAVSYQMGSVGNSINSDEVPRHEVKLPVFSISRHEVTFDQYDDYARATGKRLPHDEGWGRGKQPVINVSWGDAQGYVKWLSAQTGKTYRLPTEAEWEYAARGGSEENYWWSGLHKSIPANCFNCGSKWDAARTAPVGQFSANPYGLFDMAGNVQEWTADCYNQNYTGAPADGSAWVTPECNTRVVRGGAYSSPKDSLRSARRVQQDQETRLDNLGFRVVRVN
jgi:formylglycine-generating enzyme required for sulfatase activity/CRP-like cAMP-binding protein/chromosome segregation ATPase